MPELKFSQALTASQVAFRPLQFWRYRRLPYRAQEQRRSCSDLRFREAVQPVSRRSRRRRPSINSSRRLATRSISRLMKCSPGRRP